QINGDVSSNHSLELIPDEHHVKRCVCDFRINYSGCEEEGLLRTLHWSLVPYCTLIIMISIGFLYYRNYVLKQSFWLPSTRARGFLRPKPQEVFHLSSIVYNLFHVIHIIMVLSDAYPNYSAAEVGEDLARELALGIVLIYPISITYSTPTHDLKTNSTNNTINPSSFPQNKLIVDIIGLIFLIAPFSTLFPIAWISGHYADHQDYAKANLFSKIHTVMWTVWGLIFLSSLIYFWYKLITVIWNHIKDLKRKEVSGTSDMQWTVSTLKRAARNLCLTVFSLMIIFFVFLILSITYGMSHKTKTLFNYNMNVMYVIMWDFTIPIFFSLTQGFFLYKLVRPAKQYPPNSSIASKITSTTTKRDIVNNNNNNSQRKKDQESLYDEESSTGGGYGLNGLDAAAINSITNSILSNNNTELNRDETYRRLNSSRSLSRFCLQNVSSSIKDDDNLDNLLYPSSLTPKNSFYRKGSAQRPSLVFSQDEQISDEFDSTYNVSNGKRISTESGRIRRVSISSVTNNNLGVGTNGTTSTITNNPNNGLSIRSISSHIKHQKSFESSMDLITEEDRGSCQQTTTTTKRNRSSISVSREASDVNSNTVITASTTFSTSTTISTTTTTTLITPDAAAAAKASWDNPDSLDDRLDEDERKRISESLEKREWLSKRPISTIARRKTLLRSST
ncbi:13043_t:CDS:2, partial [Funneliformis mosseae]